MDGSMKRNMSDMGGIMTDPAGIVQMPDIFIAGAFRATLITHKIGTQIMHGILWFPASGASKLADSHGLPGLNRACLDPCRWCLIPR